MSPLTIFLLIFALLTVGGFFVLRAEVARDGGLKRWVADFPTTPGRIFFSIMLAVFFTVITMLLTVIATMSTSVTQLPEGVLKIVAGFLLLMMGLDLAAYYTKRKTHKQFADDSVPPGATAELPAQPTPGSTTVRSTGATETIVTPATPSREGA